MSSPRQTTDTTDPWSELPEGVAPPQANGEVIFDAPWQGRAFGMVHTLVDSGRFSWDAFRDELIRALDGGAVGADRYYECLLQALEQTLARHPAADADADDVLAPGDIDQRAEEFAHRPHGHDH